MDGGPGRVALAGCTLDYAWTKALCVSFPLPNPRLPKLSFKTHHSLPHFPALSPSLKAHPIPPNGQTLHSSQHSKPKPCRFPYRSTLRFRLPAMNWRTRSSVRHPLSRTESLLKYLKPGALARLRDSRISARSHRVNSVFQISPSSPPSNGGQVFSVAIDGFPCFAGTGRIYGPRCIQRKKLMAAKGMLFLNSTQSALDLPDPVLDLLASE